MRYVTVREAQKLYLQKYKKENSEELLELAFKKIRSDARERICTVVKGDEYVYRILDIYGYKVRRGVEEGKGIYNIDVRWN